MTSVVAGNMYGKGATHWFKPSLTNIARFTKGGNLFGMDSRTYDQTILDQLLAYIQSDGLPDLTTMYFMGLDHDSHAYGPAKGQLPYLVEHVDPMIGDLWAAVTAATEAPPFVAIFSDHGQIEVIPDDQHSLKIGFPFDKEMGYFFEALNLDVHDFPGEDPHCDAVMALNGGLAYVYLQNKTGHWRDQPEFDRDVYPVARAFWEAHYIGKYAPEMEGSLAGVLVRNVERDGWEAQYQALTPEGNLVTLEEWFDARPAGQSVDSANRLNNHTGLYAGDIILISNYEDKYYFGGEITGVHGGLHPDDSLATLAYGWPNSDPAAWEKLANEIQLALNARVETENQRMVSTCDMLVGVRVALGLLD
jgi:hypothetical protein